MWGWDLTSKQGLVQEPCGLTKEEPQGSPSQQDTVPRAWEGERERENSKGKRERIKGKGKNKVKRKGKGKVKRKGKGKGNPLADPAGGLSPLIDTLALLSPGGLGTGCWDMNLPEKGGRREKESEGQSKASGSKYKYISGRPAGFEVWEQWSILHSSNEVSCPGNAGVAMGTG